MSIFDSREMRQMTSLIFENIAKGLKCLIIKLTIPVRCRQALYTADVACVC